MSRPWGRSWWSRTKPTSRRPSSPGSGAKATTRSPSALLFGLNVANPEALVARHNLERLADGQAVDSAYLAEGLSLDAVPTIVDRLPTLDPFTQADLLARIGCPEDGRGWAGHNASRSAAAQALADRC